MADFAYNLDAPQIYTGRLYVIKRANQDKALGVR